MDYTREVKTFICITRELLFKCLKCRNQKGSCTREIVYNGLLRMFLLLELSIKVRLF